jgi:hypothetical protein
LNPLRFEFANESGPFNLTRSNGLRASVLTGDAFPAGAERASLTPNRGEKVTEQRQPATTSPGAAARGLAIIAMSPRFRWGPRRTVIKTNAAEQLRRSAAELWGNHEVTGEHNYSSGGAEPIASPRRIDQRAVGGSRPFGPGRSCPVRLWGTIATKKRHKQQKFARLSQNFHDGRRARSIG